MSVKKMLAVALAVALVCAAPSVGKASIVVGFDPDGGGAASTLGVTTFDWGVGNALGVAANAAVNLWVATGGALPDSAYSFNLFYQAKLSSLTLADGTVGLPPNLNRPPFGAGNDQITIVAGFTEYVQSVTGTPGTPGGVATFGLAAVQNVNYLEIYFDDVASASDANDLTGLGFNNTDGTGAVDPLAKLILRADITQVRASNFELKAGTSNLDNRLTDNYPLIDTVIGAGATNLSARVTFADSAFFTDMASWISSNILLTLFNSSQILPFDQVDPSARFLTTSTTTAAGITPTVAGAGLGVASLGTVNGGPLGLGGTGGPDIQFQVDGSSSFEIPEPASIALWSIGSAVALVVGRRRKNQSRS